MRRKYSLLALLFTLTISGVTFAHDNHSHSDDHSEVHHVEKDTRTEIKETIAHHLKDSHSFELFHGVSFPLPIILWDDGAGVHLRCPSRSPVLARCVFGLQR